MIRSFKDKEVESIWQGAVSRRLPSDIQLVARRKLRMLNAAISLEDLRIPPANRLEALKGNRANTASGSTTSGGSAFAGTTATHMTSRSWITTRRHTP
jgi:plasmid maintenance system killer protein